MFSQTAEYALRAMACLALAERDERIASTTLAEQSHVPQDYLAKVLQLLAKAGLIKGRRGVGGGYQLTRPVNEINMIEIIRAVDTIERITECPLGLENHSKALCPLHRKLDDAAETVIGLLEEATLADLLDEPGSNLPLCNKEATIRLTTRKT